MPQSKKQGVVGLLFVLAWVGMPWGWGCSRPETISVEPAGNGAQVLPVTARAVMGGETIDLEVARSPEQQRLGLMYRNALPKTRGMLFVFDPPRPVRFWMKNVNLSLDMVFLRGGEIQAIFERVPPCSADPCPTYGPPSEVDGVVELAGGRAAELGLNIGDSLAIEFLDIP